MGLQLSENILITGVNGFVGKHMTTVLLKKGRRVIGVGREETPRGSLDSYIACDLTDEDAVKNLVPNLKNINAIIHLAGIATTKNSPEHIAQVLHINVDVHRLLYKTLLDSKSVARIIAVSTGLVYELDQDMPLSETAPTLHDGDAINAYVRSKLRVEYVADEYRKKGLDIITVRPFNHTGPGQGLGFFVPDQVAKIKAALATGRHMELGDSFDFWRDFTDVRDVAKAYRLLATAKKADLSAKTYNIASGTPVFGRDLFRMIAKELNFTNYTLSTKGSAKGIPRICGDASLLKKDTGWTPSISLEQTIQDLAADSSI